MNEMTPNYQARFESLFSGLNEKQREAAENIEGPMLVVAGPGTGKTHLLAARIGQILLNTDSAPHNILCLTFTDAGVQAMRQRLVRYIGPDAHRLHIFTFHSFCRMVIADNAEIFGKNDAEPLGELERVELIRKIIDELPEKNPLKRLKNAPYYHERALHKLWTTMKAENWSVDFMLKKIAEYAEELPTKQEFIYKKNDSSRNIQKGDVKQTAIDEFLEKLEKTKAAVELFSVYEQRLHQAARYDFEDMLQWVYKAFTVNSWLLRRYQEQYLYVLIDEFQDTNGTQNAILNLLTAYWDKPNVFAVGDDDQAIYEFQGARLKNITEFYKRYEADIELVVLNDNYRATQPLLDAATSIINQNEIRLTTEVQVEKHLLEAAVKEARFPHIRPRVVAYPNSLHEEIDIVQQIIDLRERGVRLSEIAIIYREHRQANRLMDLLRKKNLPFEARRPVNVLQSRLIEYVMTVLAYLEAEHRQPYSGEAFLYEILYFHFTNIPLQDIYALPFAMQKNADNNELNTDDFDSKQIKIATKNLYSFILPFGENTHKIWKSEVGEKLAQGIIALQKNYNNVPIALLVEQIVNRLGILQWIDAQADRFTQLQIWQTFSEWLRGETSRNPRLTLPDLRRLLNAMHEANIELPLLQTSFATDAVVLTTAHSAKGLEFEYVFMIDCTKKSWEPKRANRGFSLPENLTLTNATESETEANRRLFYVAMTRAKAFLQLSYGKYELDGKDANPPILDEHSGNDFFDFKEKTLDNEGLQTAQQTLFTEQKNLAVAPYLSAPELDILLEDFALSASALNRFLKCPLSFYYQNVLRAPSVGSPHFVYGSAVHLALQRLYLRQARQKVKKMPSVTTFVKDFEHEMLRNSAILPPKEMQRLIAHGKQILPLYYEARIKDWRKDAKVEYRLSKVVWRGVPLIGVIDKMEDGMYENLKHVTDFKTAKPSTAKPLSPDEKNPQGNDYWRQLAFYKLLIENYNNLDWFMEFGTIDCVEPDKNGDFKQFTLRVAQEDFEPFKNTVLDVWKRIKNHDFLTGCGQTDCSWCNFTRKTQNTADSFHDELDAEMDD